MSPWAKTFLTNCRFDERCYTHQYFFCKLYINALSLVKKPNEMRNNKRLCYERLMNKLKLVPYQECNFLQKVQSIVNLLAKMSIKTFTWSDILFHSGFAEVQKRILHFLSPKDLFQLRFVYKGASEPYFWLQYVIVKFQDTENTFRFQCLFANFQERFPRPLMKLMMMVTINYGLSFEIAILRFYHRMDTHHNPHHSSKYTNWDDFHAAKSFIRSIDIFHLKKQHSWLLNFEKVSYLNKKGKIHFRISAIFPGDYYHIFFYYEESKDHCIDVYF